MIEHSVHECGGAASSASSWEMAGQYVSPLLSQGLERRIQSQPTHDFSGGARRSTIVSTLTSRREGKAASHALVDPNSKDGVFDAFDPSVAFP